MQGANGLLARVLHRAQFWQRWVGTPMNASWAAIGKCSADTALRDINDLLARGVLGKLEGGGRSTGYLLVK